MTFSEQSCVISVRRTDEPKNGSEHTVSGSGSAQTHATRTRLTVLVNGCTVTLASQVDAATARHHAPPLSDHTKFRLGRASFCLHPATAHER